MKGAPLVAAKEGNTELEAAHVRPWEFESWDKEFNDVGRLNIALTVTKQEEKPLEATKVSDDVIYPILTSSFVKDHYRLATTKSVSDDKRYPTLTSNLRQPKQESFGSATTKSASDYNRYPILASKPKQSKQDSYRPTNQYSDDYSTDRYVRSS